MPRPKIKICGIKNVEDALELSELEINYLGFIVNYTGSPRYITPSGAAGIITMVKLSRPEIKFVAVLVDPTESELEEILKFGCFDIVQLHGEESVEFCESVKRRGVEVWKACVVKEAGDVEALEIYRGKVDKLLVDGGRGEGKRVPLEILKGVKFDVIAGGLNAGNLREVVEVLSPEIVDLNSGVESSPGRKDVKLVEEALKVMDSVG